MIGKRTIITELSTDDLREIVREVFREEMQYAKVLNSCNSQDEIIPLKEVSKILGISLATLNRLNKNKILTNFKIGHKVFYKREDVFNAKSENNK